LQLFCACECLPSSLRDDICCHLEQPNLLVAREASWNTFCPVMSNQSRFSNVFWSAHEDRKPQGPFRRGIHVAFAENRKERSRLDESRFAVPFSRAIILGRKSRFFRWCQMNWAIGTKRPSLPLQRTILASIGSPTHMEELPCADRDSLGLNHWRASGCRSVWSPATQAI
jgi:hypothetical protein